MVELCVFIRHLGVAQVAVNPLLGGHVVFCLLKHTFWHTKLGNCYGTMRSVRLFDICRLSAYLIVTSTNGICACCRLQLQKCAINFKTAVNRSKLNENNALQ